MIDSLLLEIQVAQVTSLSLSMISMFLSTIKLFIINLSVYYVVNIYNRVNN